MSTRTPDPEIVVSHRYQDNTVFKELKQVTLKFIGNHKSPRKKNKIGGIMLLNIKLSYKAIIIKTAWYWHKNRAMEQNREPKNKLTPI